MSQHVLVVPAILYARHTCRNASLVHGQLPSVPCTIYDFSMSVCSLYLPVIFLPTGAAEAQLRARVIFCTHAMGVFLTANALDGPEDARVMRPVPATAAASSALPLFILPRPLPSPPPACTSAFHQHACR